MSDAACPRCGDGQHPGGIVRCPYVKAIELEHPGDFGSIRRVEFLTPADYPVPVLAKPPADAAPDYPRKGSSQ